MKTSTSLQPVPDDAWLDLIISILSVNNFPIEKTYAIANGLRDQGLFDPRQLACFSLADLSVRLNAGGYEHGDFMTGLFAERLAALGEWVRKQGVEACTHVLQGREAREIQNMLRRIKEIGPKVLSTFFVLRDIRCD